MATQMRIRVAATLTALFIGALSLAGVLAHQAGTGTGASGSVQSPATASVQQPAQPPIQLGEEGEGD